MAEQDVIKSPEPCGTFTKLEILESEMKYCFFRREAKFRNYSTIVNSIDAADHKEKSDRCKAKFKKITHELLELIVSSYKTFTEENQLRLLNDCRADYSLWEYVPARLQAAGIDYKDDEFNHETLSGIPQPFFYMIDRRRLGTLFHRCVEKYLDSGSQDQERDVSHLRDIQVYSKWFHRKVQQFLDSHEVIANRNNSFVTEKVLNTGENKLVPDCVVTLADKPQEKHVYDWKFYGNGSIENYLEQAKTQVREYADKLYNEDPRVSVFGFIVLFQLEQPKVAAKVVAAGGNIS
eukprot:GEMP01053699.1.p1 GENE.GEMP01053699.1~~GEMP01053699.1.p1  ORF type:complete len:292 (+),score=18.36 GEMP01053699.1:268-1143(+)